MLDKKNTVRLKKHYMKVYLKLLLKKHLNYICFFSIKCEGLYFKEMFTFLVRNLNYDGKYFQIINKYYLYYIKS